MGNSKNYPFGIWTNLLPHKCLMEKAKYTKYSAFPITFYEPKSPAQITKKQFLKYAWLNKYNNLEDLNMLYPPVADLLKNVDSRYLLVNVVAHRARQIAAEAEAFQEELPEKPVTLAIREVADGKLSGSVKEEYKN